MRANWLVVANHFLKTAIFFVLISNSILEFQIWNLEFGIRDLRFRDLTVEISNSETSVCGLSPVVLSAQGCLTSELLRFL
jgi:hypothetical protein